MGICVWQLQPLDVRRVRQLVPQHMLPGESRTRSRTAAVFGPAVDAYTELHDPDTTSTTLTDLRSSSTPPPPSTASDDAAADADAHDSPSYSPPRLILLVRPRPCPFASLRPI